MSSRRRFLAAGAATLSAPAWISHAFAQDDDDNGRDRAQELRDLSIVYRRAERAGRPLLVFVVPEDGGLRWERSSAFGELLNHGPDGVFVDLALAEVVCSSMRTLRRLVPQAGRGEPWMVLVEPDQHPAAARAIDVDIAEPPHWSGRGEAGHARRVERAIDRRIRRLAAAIHGALAADDAMVQRRARITEQRLDAALVRRVHAALRRGAPQAELVTAAPAVVRAAMRRSPRREEWQGLLLTETKVRLVQNEVPGSYWAVSGGCGATVEGHDSMNAGILCGMGYTPERSARFLYWYSST